MVFSIDCHQTLYWSPSHFVSTVHAPYVDRDHICINCRQIFALVSHAICIDCVTICVNCAHTLYCLQSYFVFDGCHSLYWVQSLFYSNIVTRCGEWRRKLHWLASDRISWSVYPYLLIGVALWIDRRRTLHRFSITLCVDCRYTLYWLTSHFVVTADSLCRDCRCIWYLLSSHIALVTRPFVLSVVTLYICCQCPLYLLWSHCALIAVTHCIDCRHTL